MSENSVNNSNGDNGNNGDEHNQGGMIAFLFSLTFVFLFFVYIVAIHPGVDLQENIRDPEPAGAAVLAAVDVSKVAEPWKPNPDMVTHGKKVFSQNCAMCHGAEGKGDGAAGAGLNPKPRNLHTGPWKKDGGFTGWMDVVTNGLPGTSMAAYGHLSVIDRWSLVQFIDSITEAKVAQDAAKIEAFAKTVK